MIGLFGHSITDSRSGFRSAIVSRIDRSPGAVRVSGLQKLPGLFDAGKVDFVGRKVVVATAAAELGLGRQGGGGENVFGVGRLKVGRESSKV